MQTIEQTHYENEAVNIIGDLYFACCSIKTHLLFLFIGNQYASISIYCSCVKFQLHLNN